MFRLQTSLLVVAVATLPALAQADEYTIDTAHSQVMFKVKHANVGYTYGRFTKFSGKLVVDKKVAKSSISLDVEAPSIYTANRKRDGHLKSPDFLNVKQFPKITFKSTKVRGRANSLRVTGQLTLHGKTKTIVAKVTKTGEGKGPGGKQRIGFETSFTLDRTQFGMTKMVGPVDKQLTIIIAVEGVK